jgi:hypothetical protein
MPGRRPDSLELQKQLSAQASQGVEYALPDAMRGRTTLFYRWVDVDTPGVHGRSYGVEQFLRRDFTHRLGGFLSYTLSRSEEFVARDVILSSYDRTHTLSVVLGYDLGDGFRVGSRAYLASGRAYRVDCPTPNCAAGGDPNAPLTYHRDLRLPSFFRLDGRFEKRWQFNNGSWATATFEWFNALVASEVDNVVYTPTVWRTDVNRRSPCRALGSRLATEAPRFTGEPQRSPNRRSIGSGTPSAR